MSFAKRFIGAENLPTRLSEFDVRQSFCLSADDIAAVAERFEHQAWARTCRGLQDLDDTGDGRRQEVLAVAALEAAHPDDLADTAHMGLYERRIVIPGQRRVADWARVAFDATAADRAATIEAGFGKAALLQAVDWPYAPQDRLVGSHLEWLKTPPKRHSPSTMAETLEKIRALKALGVHTWPLDTVPLSKKQAAQPTSRCGAHR